MKSDQVVLEEGRAFRLDDLPNELLFQIFDYCHAFDLVRLREVCKKFYAIASADLLWSRRQDKTLVTNQVSNRFALRCNPLLSPRLKWQVTHNWEFGHYQKNILFSQRIKLMPWIQLTNDMLWWSGGNQLRGYYRNNPFNSRNQIFHEEARSDICKFVIRDDYIVSGHRDGSILFWWKPEYVNLNIKNSLYDRYDVESHFYCSIERAHSRDINAIDETNDIVISGSADGTVRSWTPPNSQDQLSNFPLSTVSINDRIWSLSADPTGTKVAVGSSGTNSPPLHIYDTNNFHESNIITYPWRLGAGILDMVWDNPQTLLTCGYDTCIRKWDMRTGRCVSHWSDPTDATIYCISSDYNYTMVTGTQFNCKAVLWDQRKPQYVQLYFMNLRRMSSPIYSLSFDSSHLYGATDQSVVEMKFSGRPLVKKNYREIMKYDRFISFER